MASLDRSHRLEALVAEFLEEGRRELERELRHHAQMPDERAAVFAAASWRGVRGLIHARQRRMPRVVKEAAGKALRGTRFAGVQSFESVQQRVQAAIGHLHGVGDVTVYDVALRIGAGLGRLPTRVRLHSSVRESAALLGLEVARKRWLSVEAFPRPLHVLSACELERFLTSQRERLERLTGPRLGASLTLSLAGYLRTRARAA